MTMLIKDTYQKYERQPALNIKFEVILFYVIFRRVINLKTNLNMHYIFISYRNSSKYRNYKTIYNH